MIEKNALIMHNLYDVQVDYSSTDNFQQDPAEAQFNRASNSISINSPAEIMVPVHIVNHKSALQAIVFYLKSLGMSYSKIASVLNRDERTIWCTYDKARRKFSENQGVLEEKSDYYISLSAIKSRNFSVLESIVMYLNTEYDLSINEISILLGKKYRTIWTIHRRIRKKIENER
ncbi:TPA: hypothetical protein HA363_00935 [Candidatus Woesearchaeota archaeon]|nr:hypothetical protein [Candidatus Woesearchaeota archaeon]